MKTAIKQAIDSLEQQRKALREMELLGILLENEFAHKSNQINSIQILLSNLIETEKLQIEKAYYDGCIDFLMETATNPHQYYSIKFPSI
jgi:hypothetical protein